MALPLQYQHTMSYDTKNESIPSSETLREGRILAVGRRVTGRYEPENETEKGLDFWINLKLDFLVVLPLSLGFMFIASRSPSLQASPSRIQRHSRPPISANPLQPLAICQLPVPTTIPFTIPRPALTIPMPSRQKQHRLRRDLILHNRLKRIPQRRRPLPHPLLGNLRPLPPHQHHPLLHRRPPLLDLRAAPLVRHHLVHARRHTG